MGLRTERREEIWQSINGNPSYAEPIANEGCSVEIQTVTAPAALVTLEGSQDRYNWVVLTDHDGNAISALGAGVYRSAREMPPWIRVGTASDVGGARTYRTVVTQTKLTH